MHAVLIGCGKMGSAMARSWLDSNLVETLHIVDPAQCPFDDSRVTHSTSLDDIDGDIIILAVKPQILHDALKNITLPPDSVVVSIAAGQSLRTLASLLGAQQPVIRSMPNTPAAIGKGISVSVAGEHVTPKHAAMAERLLQACGAHHWIEDESHMDAVTALSGSGPAYVFHLIECLQKAGQAIGLDENLSLALARQTVIGSAALAEHDSHVPASTLRENVTSPNGTTQAGLDVLMDGRFASILEETLRAAKKRSEELNV